MSATQNWIKEQYKKDSVTVWGDHKLTKEAQDLKARVKKLETDMAFLIKEKNEE
jgi:hypothetical protein